MKNTFEIVGEKVFIDINVKGLKKQTVIDLVDLERVSSMSGTWYGDVDSRSGKIYVFHTVKHDGKWRRVALQRFILGLGIGDGFFVDHLNHNTLDNTRGNLKATSFQRNIQRKLVNISQVKRVKTGWGVIVKGELVGTYETKEQAQVMSVVANMEHYAELKEFICFDSVMTKFGYDIATVPIKLTENGELDFSKVTPDRIRKWNKGEKLS